MKIWFARPQAAKRPSGDTATAKIGLTPAGSGWNSTLAMPESAPAWAPCSIHSLISPSSAGVGLLALTLLSLGGMNGSAEREANLRMGLSSGLPATTAGPCTLPPLRIDSRVSSDRPLSFLLALWQAVQLRLRICFTSPKPTGLSRLTVSILIGSARKSVGIAATHRVRAVERRAPYRM